MNSYYNIKIRFFFISFNNIYKLLSNGLTPIPIRYPFEIIIWSHLLSLISSYLGVRYRVGFDLNVTLQIASRVVSQKNFN